MRELVPKKAEPLKVTQSMGTMLSRKCACGGPGGTADQCNDCQKKRLIGTPTEAVRPDTPVDLQSGSGSLPQSELEQTPILRRAEGSSSIRLGLSQPGDACEIEADAVAERIVANGLHMNSFPAHPVPMADASRPSRLYRQADEDVGLNADLADMPDTNGHDDAESDLGDDIANEAGDQDDITCDESGCPKRESNSLPESAARVASVRIPRNGGRTLDLPLRTLMESRFGHDFARVSVHTDLDSARSARQLKAHAYTVGSHIYFAAGQYKPQSADGLKLLAHELTHVVQQSRQGWSPGAIHRKKKGKKKKAECSGECVGKSAPKHDGCVAGTAAINASKYIDSILVERGGHTATATWSDKSTTTYPCSPSTKAGKHGKIPTPISNFTVGVKCDACHTNHEGAGMAWFTGIVDKMIGFHNSQDVGPTHESHGCIRVSCEHAKEIHDNTTSGKTTVKVVR
jgi:hypothetical protein